MSKQRFRYVAAFFIVWTVSIVVRQSFLALFGPYAAVRYSFLNIFAYLLISILGTVCLVPATLSELIRRADLAKGHAFPVDQLFLESNMRRANISIACLVAFAAIILVGNKLHTASIPYALLALVVAALARLRIILLTNKIQNKVYCANASETRELLTFMLRIFQIEDATPPSRLPPTPPGQTLSVEVPYATDLVRR